MAQPAGTKRTLGQGIKAAVRAVVTWFWTNVLVGLFGIWLVGQAFRDRSRFTVLCFLVPTVCVVAGLVLAAFLARLCTCRRLAWASVLLALPPAFSLLFLENHWIRPRRPASVGETLRLVHWNVWCGHGSLTVKAQRLKPLDADIYVLSEVLQPKEVEELLQVLGPEYSTHQVRQLAVFARGRVALERVEERVRHHGYLVHWDSKAGPLHLFLVDLPARPIYDVNPLLNEVHDHILSLEPDITVGDFNVSRRTRALSRLPKGYSHAYYRAGVGWSYTFPAEFPLWDIDQCIIGPRIVPVRYGLVTTRLSDHRMQVLDFAIATPRPGP